MVGPMAASAWELVPTTHAPQARTSMAMCALNGGGILLFGGSDGETSGFFKGDTWILSDGDWMNVAVPSAPIARSNAGCVAYKDGAVLFGGFWQDPSAYHSIGVRDDTWMFTPSNGQRNAGTWRELKLAVHPPARAYFSFSPYLGGGLLFGGRNNLYTNTLTVLDDTWTFHNGGWHEVLSARHSSKVLQSLSQPSPTARFGHVVACGLNATVPPAHVENAGITGEPKETFEGPADCMLFGGAVYADEDYFGDTWLLLRNRGKPVWKQQVNWPAPRGRWCNAQATCPDGGGVVMTGGSIDYRVSDAGTWLWTPTPIPHEESTENPGHPPGHTGLWKLVDPGTSGPNRTAGLMMATDEKMGIIAFGGAGPATGGNHPGKYTNQTWRWKC